MTTRTLAATTAALPQDTPDRRTMLAGAGAAAVLAAIGLPAVVTLDPDAELIALGTKWRETNRAFIAAMCATDDATDRAWATLPEPVDDDLRRGAEARHDVPAREAVQDAASRADSILAAQIAATPAKTLAGVVLKVEVSADWSHEHEDLVPSIMADVLAYAAAQKESRAA